MYCTIIQNRFRHLFITFYCLIHTINVNTEYKYFIRIPIIKIPARRCGEFIGFTVICIFFFFCFLTRHA